MKLNLIIPLLLLIGSIQSQAQIASDSKAVLSIRNSTQESEHLKALPHSTPLLSNDAPLPLPLLRVPDTYYKKYLIRIKQLDYRQLRQNPVTEIYTYSAKSPDHIGYDFFLPVSFSKIEAAEAFLTRLPHNIKQNAVLVKLEPITHACNCSNRN